MLRQTGRFESAAGARHDLEPKDALLLAYLAIEGSTPRGRLAALLWPDVDDERARGNLRQRLLRLKRTTGAELVTGNPQARLAGGVSLDLEGTHELLAGLGLEQAGGLAEWLDARRERRRRDRGAALANAAAKAQAEGEYALALEHANGLAELDPCSEEAHRQLMRLHYLRGDAGAALAAYERCARLLRDELGVEPSQETSRLRSEIGKAASATPAASARPSVPVTILRPPRLIGREAELAAFAQAWDSGRAFLLLGEAGMGKSRLLAELAAARSRVVVAQARPGDAGVPYATLARLLRTVLAGRQPDLPDGSSNQLARVLPELRSPVAPSPGGQTLQLQQAIEAVVLNAQREGIQGVVLDDVHFADEASVEMLCAILSGDHAPGLHWGFAQRSGEPIAATRALREALEEALSLVTVALPPLDVRQMAQLVESLGLPEIDGCAIAERLVRHTGGNPMFALETLKHALATSSGGVQLPRPASVGALIERRLRQLSAPAIALARVAAVAGVDFSIEMAEHVLKTPALALADAWNELEAAQVFRGAAFAHDLVFEAALRSMPEVIATHTHASIAEWLERSDGEPARIAAHWMATTTPERALPWLHRAAERAAAGMRAHEAIDFLVRAADIEAETATHEQAFETLATIVDNRHYVDRGADQRRLLNRLDQLAANPFQRIGALLLRSDNSMHRKEQLDEGLAAAERAVELATQAGIDWFRVAGALNVAILQTMKGEYARAAEGANALLAEVRRWPDPRQRCNLLGKIGFVLDRAGRTCQALELFDAATLDAQTSRYPIAQISALANAADALLRLGRPEDALRRLERSDALRAAHDKLEGAGDANDRVAARGLRLLGRYSEALTRAQRAIEAMRARSPGSVASAIATRANLWLDLGQLARALQDRELARRAANEPVEERVVALLDLRLATEANVRADAAYARGRALLDEQPQLAMELTARLQLASLAPPAEALVAARDVAARARLAEFRGLETAAASRTALAELQSGDAVSAVAHARLSIELGRDQNTEDLSWPAIVQNAAVVLQRAGHTDEARRVVSRGEAWLREIAGQGVPPEFRDSFLNRNPVNRELLRLATRLR